MIKRIIMHIERLKLEKNDFSNEITMSSPIAWDEKIVTDGIRVENNVNAVGFHKMKVHVVKELTGTMRGHVKLVLLDFHGRPTKSGNHVK